MRPQNQLDNERALTEALLATLPLRAKLEALGRVDDLAVLSVTQYAILFNFDLSCLMSDIAPARGNWRSKLFARTLATALFECVEDVPQLLGKQFRTIVSGRSALDPKLLGDLETLMKDFRSLKTRCQHHFAVVRHGTGAHRDLDASAQIETIKALNTETLITVSQDMMAWLTKLHQYLGRLIDLSARAGG
jgi:hypothetical protein